MVSLAVTHKPNSSRAYSLTQSMPVISFPVHSRAYCVYVLQTDALHLSNKKAEKGQKYILKMCQMYSCFHDTLVTTIANARNNNTDVRVGTHK